MRLFALTTSAVLATSEISYTEPSEPSFASSYTEACSGDMFIISGSSCDIEAFYLKLNDATDADGRKCYESLLPDSSQLFHSQNVANDAECDQQGKQTDNSNDVIQVQYSTTCLIQETNENGKTIYTTGLCESNY